MPRNRYRIRLDTPRGEIVANATSLSSVANNIAARVDMSIRSRHTLALIITERLTNEEEAVLGLLTFHPNTAEQTEWRELARQMLEFFSDDEYMPPAARLAKQRLVQEQP